MELPKEIGGLKDLIDGEVGYTVPWAMYPDKQGSLWLNGNYTLESNSTGTNQMKVTKKKGLYICDVTKCEDHRQMLQDYHQKGSCFIGKFVPLPVAKVIGME